MNIDKDFVRQIANEQIELHESKGKKYGLIGLLIMSLSYTYLIYLIISRT